MFDPDRLKRIEAWMTRYVDANKYPGSNVLIRGDGREMYYAEAGLRDVEQGLPFTRDTIVRLYSMTKPATSAILMMLVEEGLVHLDARVSQFIPEFGNCRALIPDARRLDQTMPCAAPTLHQLLTHTSGLSYPFNPGMLPAAMDADDLLFKANQGPLAQEVSKVAALPLAFQPGTRWEYSVGIDVIGRVIEVIEGDTLDNVFRKRLLGPLGMDRTAFSVPEDGAGDFAALYTPLDGDAMALGAASSGAGTLRCVDRAEGSAFLNATTFSGGGGLVGTIDDYMAFAEFLHTGMAGDTRLLSKATLDFMMQNHLPGDIASMGPMSFAEQPMEGMGFGIGGAVVLDAARARTPGSPGDFSWGGIASTFFWIDRVRGVSVVFLTQVSPSSSHPARPELKALVHGALA